LQVKNGDEEMDSEALQSIFETSDTREIVQYFLEEDAAEDEYYARRFAMLQPDRPAQ
jgi:ribosome maturation protein Sdo1